VRHERSIRRQEQFLSFLFKKEVSCDASGRLDTKTIFIILVFKIEV